MTLSDYLKRNEITPKEFAEQIDAHWTSLYAWMRGERRPRGRVMARIAAQTGGAVTPNDFYGMAGPVVAATAGGHAIAGSPAPPVDSEEGAP